MIDRSNKKRLYCLMEKYLSGAITARIFCDEFYYSYDLEVEENTLSPIERKVFSTLGEISGRFSEYDSDHQKSRKAFVTENELKKSILFARNKLFSSKDEI